MSIREHIQRVYQTANTYARIADQLEAIEPVVRTPADRSRDQHQPPLLNDTDCDVKLPSMIVVEHLPKEAAERVRDMVKAKFGEIANVYREVALNTMKGAGIPSPYVEDRDDANTGD